MKRVTLLLLIVGVITSPVSAAVTGKITAGAWNAAGYFYSETDEIGTGNIRLHNGVEITGIAYTSEGLTLRAGVGQSIQDGFPTPLRLVLTQTSAPTRDRQFGRRIEFSHLDLDTHGRYAYIRHKALSGELSKDLRLIGEDIQVGDVFWIYVYGNPQGETPPHDATEPEPPQGETPPHDATDSGESPPSEQPPPDVSQTLYEIEFTLGWTPLANHKYLWETRDFGDKAFPEALVADDGTEVEINRIACDTPEMRFISYADDLREVFPEAYTLKIRKVWTSGTDTVHLRVLTNDAAVRVAPLGAGSMLIVPKDIGSWTPEPQSPQRVSHYHTIGGICANTIGRNANAYLHLVITETRVQRAPRSPYLRKLTGTWGALKKQ